MRNWLLSCAILLAVTLALRLGLAKKLGPTLAGGHRGRWVERGKLGPGNRTDTINQYHSK